MFSLCSNFIELRYAQFFGAIFSKNFLEFNKNQKQLGIRFAHTLFILALLDIKSKISTS